MTPVEELVEEALCQHVNYERRRCVRPAHGDEIRHAYTGNRQIAGQRIKATHAAVKSAEERLPVAKIGRFAVGIGESVGLDSSGTVPHEGRGWLGVLKGVYRKDGKVFAEIVGAKTGKAVKERIVPVERLEYIRPGTDKARKAKIRVGRAV